MKTINVNELSHEELQKQVSPVNYQNPSFMQDNELCKAYKQINLLKKELANREEQIKKEMKTRFKVGQDRETYDTEEYRVVFKEVITKRLDSKKVMELVQGDIVNYQTESKSVRMSVERKN